MHPATLFLELGGVIFSLGILGRFASAIGLTPVPLYLLVGLGLGKGGVLPLLTSRGFIETGADIGVVLLLLTLGLEYSVEELMATLRTHASSGVVDLVLNALPGIAVALIYGWGPIAALALAGVTAVSSSGIVSKMLGDLGRLANRETPAILGVLVFEDLAMAVYLPVLTGLLARKAVGATVVAVVIALGALVVAFTVALRFARVINRLVFSPNDEVLLLRILGLALLVAGLADRLQVSAAVGAFLVGIALSGKVADDARALLTPLRDLFAAVFFVFFGLQTDPAALPRDLWPALLMAIAGVATKGATGWYAARRSGVGRGGQIRAGTSLIARGEFSIVIAGVTVAAGGESRLATLSAAYVVILAVLGPVATRLADPLARVVARVRTGGASTPGLTGRVG